MPKVSIIIPIYNSSKYLKKCLDSVINQTLEDIEILIINDCSPDPKDDEICREFQKKDERIIYLIHKHNKGLGGARNTGLINAKANYIGFLDSDDWINCNMYEELYDDIKEQDWDVVICGYKFVYEHQIVSGQNFKKSANITEETQQKNIFKISNNAVWNKLWKKSLFVDNGIFFPEYVYYQDLAISPKLYFHAKRIKYIKKDLYYYRWNFTRKNSSATFSISQKNIDDYFKVFDIQKEFLIEKGIFCFYKSNYYINIYENILYHIRNISKFENEKCLKTYYLEIINQFIEKVDLKDFFLSFEEEELKDLFQFRELGKVGKKFSVDQILKKIKRKIFKFFIWIRGFISVQ